jgi:hypothetical protein
MRRIRTVLVLQLVVICALLGLVPSLSATKGNSAARPKDKDKGSVTTPTRVSHVFGPVHYRRNSWRPFWTIQIFTVKRPGPGLLRIDNGGDHNQFRRVTSGAVWINGQRVMGPSDFRRERGEILERKVHLKAWNWIAVEIERPDHSGFTLVIDAQAADTFDTAPPVITGTSSPAANSNSWNNTDVTVSFTCSDVQSGIESCSGPTTIANDGASQTITGTARDRAGNTASATVTVNLDKSNPSIAASRTPAANAAGWNNTDVAVSFTCNDALSGIGSCSPASNVTSEGASQAVSGTAVDRASNSATASTTVSLDKTAPALSITPMPATVTDPSLDVTGTVTDALSGVDQVTCNGTSASRSGNSYSCTLTLTEGDNTINVSATDWAGNTAQSSANVALSSFVAPPFGPVLVTWMNLSGVAANGNSISKNNPAAGWNSGAVSKQVLPDGNGFVEFTATETNTSRVAGLGVVDTDQNYTDVDFAFMLQPNSTLSVYEGGVQRTSPSAYAAGDRLRVEVRYGAIRYLRNGAVLYSSTVPARYPLRVDTALNTTGATLTDVRVGNFIWTDNTGVSISGESLRKTAGTAWNAGAVSADSIESGDGYMEFTATETNTTRAAGLAGLVLGTSLADIRFGIKVNDNATVEVVENGVSQGVFGSYSGGDRFRIETSGGVVRYFRNQQQMHMSLQTPTYPLRVDAALFTGGATLTDVILEPMSWANAQNVHASGATLMKTSADGWTGSVSSATRIQSGDGYVEFTAVETDSRRGMGLKWSPAGASQPTDFQIALTETGSVEVVEAVALRGQFGSYQNGDRFRIEISNGSIRYLRNGTLMYTSGANPPYPLHAEGSFFTRGATLFDVAMGDLVWVNDVNVRIAGRGLLKTSPMTAWNAGATSTRVIDTGYVEVTASEISTTKIVGLGSGDPNQPIQNIDFSIMLRGDARIGVYELGVLRGFFPAFVAGDRFRVEVQTGGTVRYLRNGLVFYTSTLRATTPLRVDTGANEGFGTMFNIVAR